LFQEENPIFFLLVKLQKNACGQGGDFERSEKYYLDRTKADFLLFDLTLSPKISYIELN
jgi:hypothetical protein